MILANQSAASQHVPHQLAKPRLVVRLPAENRALLVQPPARLLHRLQRLQHQPKQHLLLHRHLLLMLKNSPIILV